MRWDALILVATVLFAACSPAAPAGSPSGGSPASASAALPTEAPIRRTLTIYSAREEVLVQPLIDQFSQTSGVEVKVKYGSNAELVAAIREEGANSPADVFLATDAGGLQALQDALASLPREVLDLVPPEMRAPDGRWVSISGRARVVVYNTKKLTPADLPESIDGYTEPKWKGRLGWSPTNGSFQAFLTAYRMSKGEEAAKQWVNAIKANEPKSYANNTAIVDAAAKGEIDAGFTNHYYLFRFLAERGESFTARNYYFKNGDIGGLMLANGAATLSTSKNPEGAHRFISFMLSAAGQQYFADKTYEYPLVQGVSTSPLLPALQDLKLFQIDQIKLGDAAGTQKLLRETGVLP